MDRTIAAMLVALALMATACRVEEADTASSPPAAGLRTASQGLCDAQVLASEGNLAGAAGAFDAQTHDYLHELADMLQEVDPEAAADLLEAKQQVESALDDRGDPVAVQDLLVRLQRALHDAAEAADLPPPLCREGAA